MVGEPLFNKGFKLLEENFGKDFTQAQKNIIKDSFRTTIAPETWEAMMRVLIETQTYLPRTDAFYKARYGIKETSESERVHVPCHICDGVGLIAAIGKFGEAYPNMRYTRQYRCSCPNSKNWSKQIKRRSEATGAELEQIEMWVTQRQIQHEFRAYDERPDPTTSGNLGEALKVIEDMIPV